MAPVGGSESGGAVGKAVPPRLTGSGRVAPREGGATPRPRRPGSGPRTVPVGADRGHPDGVTSVTAEHQRSGEDSGEDLEPVVAGRTVDFGRAILATVALMFLTGAAVYAWQQAAAEPSPNEVDIGFADDMRTHHLQGVTMSLTYIDRGTDPLMRRIAEEIVIVQAGESRLMGQWLIDWGDPDLDLDSAMGWMGMSPVPQTEQPGMATEADLAALDELEGEELDELWSRLMIEHHRGGGHMARYVTDHATEDEVRELADAMLVTQQSEIGELNLRREAMGFEPA